VLYALLPDLAHTPAELYRINFDHAVEPARKIGGDLGIVIGGNFVDTADVYSKGVSEEITGSAIKGVRDDVVLATKVRFPMGDGPNEVGLSRKHVTQGCEDSLRRLGIDYIDSIKCIVGTTSHPLRRPSRLSPTSCALARCATSASRTSPAGSS
jgi:hypothetical protein